MEEDQHITANYKNIGKRDNRTTEKPSFYHLEIMSWNPHDAIAIHGWKSQRAKLTMLSGKEGWHMRGDLSSINHNNISQIMGIL